MCSRLGGADVGRAEADAEAGRDAAADARGVFDERDRRAAEADAGRAFEVVVRSRSFEVEETVERTPTDADAGLALALAPGDGFETSRRGSALGACRVVKADSL